MDSHLGRHRMSHLIKAAIEVGEWNGNPLQYFCLGNPMDRGAWWATVHGVVKSRTQLSDLTATKQGR